MADDGGPGAATRTKGWLAALAAMGAGIVFYCDVGGLVTRDDLLREHHRELGIGFGGFGILLALAITFRGTEFGFRVQSLILCLAAAGVTCVFALMGFDRGWGVGSGALTFIFGVVALVKLKHVLLGRTPPPEEG